MKIKNKKQLIIIGITTSIGLASGFLYWQFVGCSSGTCPIWANPYMSTSYGALLGYFIGDTIKNI